MNSQSVIHWLTEVFKDDPTNVHLGLMFNITFLGL